MKIERCACYIRVSTDEQRQHGLSLDAQRDKLKEYARKNHLKIVEWYEDEGVSGAKLIKNRPELQRMINDAKKRNFERIIFIRLDRFFRSVAEYHECMKIIDPVVWTATEEERYDLSTASGRAYVNMKLTIAEYEAGNTGEKIRDVNDFKVKTGQPLTGSVPRCYMIIKTENGKRLVRNPEMEEITFDMIDHVKTHQSKSKTLKYINRKYNMNFSYSQLDRLLKTPMLYGEYRGNPDYIEEKERYMTKAEFEIMHGSLKHQVKDNSRRDYLFTGLIKCPHCGRLLKAGMYTTTNKYGIRYIYLKYRCHLSKVNGTCDFKKVISENVLERMMLDQVEQFLKNEKVSNAEILEANHMPDTEAELKDLQAERDRLNYAWQKGRIKDMAKYDSEYDRLSAEIDALKNKKVEVEKRDFSKIESALSGNWKDIYNELDPKNKRAFWRSFVKSIEIEWTTKTKRITKVNFF